MRSWTPARACNSLNLLTPSADGSYSVREDNPTFRSPFSIATTARCCGKSAPRKLAVGEQRREAFRLDLNADIWVRLDDLERQVKLKLVDMSECAARLRSTVLLAPDAAVSFRWMGPSRNPIVVHGHVADVTMADKRTADYNVEFSMPLTESDRLARELQEMQRRKTVRISDDIPELTEDGDLGGVARRKAYRALVQFPVTIKTGKRGRWITMSAEARDLSVGGMMLLLPDDLQEGAEIELTFTLPADHEAKAVATKEVVEITPFGERRIRKPAAARTWEVVQTKARVLKKLGNARSGAPMFGVAFIELPGFYHEEIARWLHAHQLRQLRKSPGGMRRANIKHTSRKLHPAAELRGLTATLAVRPPVMRPDPGRRYIAAEIARKREFVEVPRHECSPGGASEGDIFGLGEPAAAPVKPILGALAPRECYILGDADVFGLGAAQEAS